MSPAWRLLGASSPEKNYYDRAESFRVMNVSLDSGKLLYVFGVLFALAAFLYFVRDVVFGLSITVTAALLFGAFLCFVATGLALRRDVLDLVAFALGAVAYVVFLGYVIVRYDLGDTTTFLLFAASAGLFLALGYAIRETTYEPSGRTAVALVGGVLVVSLVLVGADVAGGGVTYTAELNGTVTVAPPTDAPQARDTVPVTRRIGSVTAANPSVFTRALSLPSARACLVGDPTRSDGIVDIRYDRDRFSRSEVIPGGVERRFDLTARLSVAPNASTTTYQVVERADCDVSPGEPTIVVLIGEGALPGPDRVPTTP